MLMKIGVTTSARSDTCSQIFPVFACMSFLDNFHYFLPFFIILSLHLLLYISHYPFFVPFVLSLRASPSFFPFVLSLLFIPFLLSSRFYLLSSIFLLHLSLFSSLHRAIFPAVDCRHHLSLLRNPPANTPHLFPAVLVTIRWRARVLLLVVCFLKCFGCLSWLFLWTCFGSKPFSVILRFLVALCLHETEIHFLAAAPVLGG